MVAEIIDKLQTSGYIKGGDNTKINELKGKATKGKKDPFLDGLQALNVIEYGRTVHAEMAALSDAARHGVSVKGATMYVNTFPCHICARHIVAAGIKRVVFIQPYPKSLTGRLFADSVTIGSSKAEAGKVKFQPFSGVAPRSYQFSFQQIGKRKDDDGIPVNWSKATASTKFLRYVYSYIMIENQVVNDLLPQVYYSSKGGKRDGNTKAALRKGQPTSE